MTGSRTFALLTCLVLSLAACFGEAAPDTAGKGRLLFADRDSLSFIRPGEPERTIVVKFDDGSQPYFPAISPDGKTIAFSVLRAAKLRPDGSADFGADLSIVGRDGKDLREVAHHSQVGELIHGAAWLNERELLFEVQGRRADKSDDLRLEKIEVRTGVRTRLADDVMRPAVSSDGRLVAAVRLAGELQELIITDPDFRTIRVLVKSTDGLHDFSSLAFSPDGSKLAFAAEDGNQGLPPPAPAGVGRGVVARAAHPAASDVWVVNLDGSNLRRVADLGDSRPSLAFSGDGNLLYVLGISGLWLIDIEDGGARRIEGTLSGGDIVRLPLTGR